MKSLWALPAALRLVVALERPFSVQNDLLAFPQYEIVYSEAFIPEAEASRKLQQHAQGSDIVSDGRHQQQVLHESHESFDTEQDLYQRMILNGTSYLCRIPYVPPDDMASENATAASQSEQQQELVRASDHGWELLGAMQGNCLYFGGGWWVYSFCYGDAVRQFHPLPPGRNVPPWPPTPDQSIYNFVLGRFKPGGQNKDISRNDGSASAFADPSDASNELQTRGESNFLVQKLGGGTMCDLTGVERRVEVQYHCNPGATDRISMIKETASCVYLMVVHTPRLCNDAAFLPPQLDRPNTISCQEIVAKEDEKRWKAVKAAQVKADFMKASDNAQGDSSKPVTVGGIVVGGQKQVGGSPDRQIKVSNIAKPRKLEDKEERFIVTLAESDGRKLTVLNEREIQKYDLKKDLEDIEEFIMKTENWAEGFREGQPWRLDVVQTPEGINFRGILIDDDDVESSGGGSGSGSGVEKGGRSTGEEQHEGSEEEYKKGN